MSLCRKVVCVCWCGCSFMCEPNGFLWKGSPSIFHDFFSFLIIAWNLEKSFEGWVSVHHINDSGKPVYTICIKYCIRIPVPDTDCQGPENQFLRRSGWQVASQEQSTLRKRHTLNNKLLFLPITFNSFLYICNVLLSQKLQQKSGTIRIPLAFCLLAYLKCIILGSKKPFIISSSIMCEHEYSVCVTQKSWNALWIRRFYLNNDAHHWLWPCDMIQSRSIIGDSAVERSGNILSCFLHLLIQLAWLMDGTESTGPFKLTKLSFF